MAVHVQYTLSTYYPQCGSITDITRQPEPGEMEDVSNKKEISGRPHRGETGGEGGDNSSGRTRLTDGNSS